jgi:hypothetical protein
VVAGFEDSSSIAGLSAAARLLANDERTLDLGNTDTNVATNAETLMRKT